MRDLLADFRKKSSDTYRDWELDFLLPYCRGYNKGYLAYTATLDAQKKADEEAAQRKLAIGMLILSFVGGNVLTRVFGGATVNHLAAKGATGAGNLISPKLTRELTSILKNSPVQKFTLGDALDKSSEYISSKIMDKLKEYASGSKTADSFAKDPLDAYLSMKEWLGDLYRIIDETADDFEKQFADDAKFKEKLDELLTAPFFKYKPTTKVSAESIESETTLVLLLKYVTDQDYYYETEMVEVGRGHRTYTKKTPLNERTDSPNYPLTKPYDTGPSKRGGYVSTGVGYEQLGATIRAKLNEVYKKRIGGGELVPAADGPVTPGILRQAEVTLDFIESTNLKALGSQKL